MSGYLPGRTDVTVTGRSIERAIADGSAAIADGPPTRDPLFPVALARGRAAIRLPDDIATTVERSRPGSRARPARSAIARPSAVVSPGPPGLGRITGDLGTLASAGCPCRAESVRRAQDIERLRRRSSSPSPRPPRLGQRPIRRLRGPGSRVPGGGTAKGPPRRRRLGAGASCMGRHVGTPRDGPSPWRLDPALSVRRRHRRVLRGIGRAHERRRPRDPVSVSRRPARFRIVAAGDRAGRARSPPEPGR